MVYDAWRVNGGPTQHPPNPTAVTVDVLEVGFIFAIVTIAFCFALVVPGYRGWSRFFFCCRSVMSLFILGAVLLGVLGQEWEAAELSTRTPYKAFTAHEIHANVGMRIGLASVNITLKTDPVVQEFPGNVTETINYNERFHWDWRQGRLGFGPFSGRIQQEFREAQFRGIPLPILWIAEYFTLDGELIRWGRSYRTAGWFTWIVLWTAFPTWIIANILSPVVLFYAGFMYLVTGGLMLVSTIIWASIRWGHQPLVIPFEDGMLYTHYGPAFWLVVAGGIISCFYGILIICMDLWAPQAIADFFGNDVLQDAEQFYHKSEEDEEDEGNGVDDVEATKRSHRGGVQKRAANRHHADSSHSKRFVSRRRKNRDHLLREIEAEKNGVTNSAYFAPESIKAVDDNGGMAMQPINGLDATDGAVKEEQIETPSGSEQQESAPQSNSEKGSLSSENEENKKIIEDQASIHSYEAQRQATVIGRLRPTQRRKSRRPPSQREQGHLNQAADIEELKEEGGANGSGSAREAANPEEQNVYENEGYQKSTV